MTEETNRQKPTKKHYFQEFKAQLGLISKVKPDLILGTLTWTIIGIALTLFVTIFFGSLSVFLSLKSAIGWELLLLCLIIAGIFTLIALAVVVRFPTIFVVLINWLVDKNKKNGIVDMDNDRKINPWGWGILFFTLWLSLITIPNIKGQPIYYLSYMYGGFSILMLISIIRPIRDWISRKTGNFVATMIFFGTIMSFAVAFMLALVAVDASIREFVAWFGFIWLAVYLSMLSSRSHVAFGIIVCISLLSIGIYDFITQTADVGKMSAIILSLLAIDTLVCSLIKPKFLAEIPLI